jgi:RND superfamily putative drug exporter
LAAVGVTGQGLCERVSSKPPQDPASESAAANRVIDAAATTGTTLMVQVRGVAVDDQTALGSAAAVVGPVLEELSARADVAQAIAPFAMPGWPDAPESQALVASDRQGFLVTVSLKPHLSSDDETTGEKAVRSHLEKLAKKLGDLPGVKATVGGETMVFGQLTDQMEADLATGELVSLPVALIVMVLVFAGFAAAALPLLGALASIATALGALFGLSYALDMHTSVINVITVISVGLSVDSGLLGGSRYREELRTSLDGAAHKGRGDPVLVERAMETTIATAGRTVMFSALTIAACVAGLLAFSPPILRGFGLGGFVAVLLALLTATTLVPACLVLLGERLVHRSPLARVPLLGRLMSHKSDLAPESGVFSKLAHFTQRFPWLVVVAVLALLALIASPALDMRMRNSGLELLPKDASQRIFLTDLDADYPALRTPAIEIVSDGTLEETAAWADQSLAKLALVDAATPSQQDGYVDVSLRLKVADASGSEATDLVKQIRSERPGFDFKVTGPAAQLVDFTQALKAGAPVAVAIIVLAAFLLLFGMTGSLLIPLTALVTNGISLLACLGAVTWLFQNGHLGSLLGYSAVDGIETYIVVLLLIFGFGLAIDYEVFLISRIKEARDSGLDTEAAVRYGLQRSGRVITSAALIIVVVFAGFAAGKLVVIKEIGIGLALTVALDATLIRMLLVPATMTLLGKANWWAPAPLQRLQHRLSARVES